MSICSRSIDYSQLHQELLGPTPTSASVAPGSGTRRSLLTHVRNPPSQLPTTRAEVDSLEGLGLLPSTVPETLENEDSNAAPDESSKPFLHATRPVEQKMNNGESPEDTQPISQSFVDEYVRRSRSARTSSGHDEVLPTLAEGDETQMTVLEGEDGYVDICSSYQQADEVHSRPLEETAASEPVAFSPTQTQPDLTQFPESQRFKTPATVLKERKSSRNLLDSPALPRNPLANAGQVTPARLLGLSQAFEATQAVSSPIVNAVLTQLHSDRPSPNLNLQPRPTTAPTSSPLRPISEPKRAGSDPAAHYVSVHRSQATRLDSNDPDQTPSRHYESQASGPDGFSDVPSSVVRQRRARERENRAREDLARASSPPCSARPDPRRSGSAAVRSGSEAAPLPSSPPSIRSLDPNFASTRLQGNLGNTLSPVREPDAGSSERSDAEDNEDEVDLDLEPRIMHVPRTSKREVATVSYPGDSTLNSPLMSRGVTRPAQSTSEDIDSSSHIRVANSQPSKTRFSALQPSTETNEDSVDRIPASQEQDGFNMPQGRHDTDPSGLAGSSIPETSSNTRPQTDDVIVHQVSPGGKGDNAKSTTHQTTTHDSSQPIRTTPPGRKRKRMPEVVQDLSPAKDTSQEPSFHASQVLALSQDPTTAAALAGSACQTQQTPQKRQRRYSYERIPRLQIEETRTQGENNPSANIGRRIESRIPTEQVVSSAEVATSPLQNADEVIHTTQNETSHPRTPSQLRSSASKWDIGPSPVQLKIPRQTSASTQPVRKTVARKRPGQQPSASNPKATSALSLKAPAATAPSKLNDSSDPLAISSTSPTPAKDTASRSDIVASQMVFAYYFGKNRTYYPARCIGPDPSKDGYFIVQWDGFAPDSIDRYGICSLELRVGDLVKVDMDGFAKIPYVVRELKHVKSNTQQTGSITDIFGHWSAVVAPKQRKSLPGDLAKAQDVDVPISALYLDSNMWSRIKNRGFYVENTFTKHPETGTSTPLIHQSTPKTPNSRYGKIYASSDTPYEFAGTGLFVNMTFALSFEASSTKDIIARYVRENGGTILEGSFADMFDDTLEIKTRFSSVGFCGLLADKHSRKEKYMQALALGLPCLSGKWIEHSLESEQLAPWQDYLLPAGESVVLDGAIRSRILSYGAMTQPTLKSMLKSRKDFFELGKIVFVTGRGKAEAKRLPYLFFAQAMGAGSIEKVSDLHSAKIFLKGDQSSGRSWVLVDERDLQAAEEMISHIGDGNKKTKKRKDMQQTLRRCKVIDNEFMVQSLILDRWCERVDF